jgi:AraC-like DNA-binding protein
VSLLPEQRVLTTLHTVVLATQVVGQSGVELQRLLEGSGITAGALDNPAKLVTHAQELQVLANALNCSEDAALGLTLGQRMHVSAYGILGYCMLASRTLGEALQLAIEHPALFGSYFKLTLLQVDDEVRLTAAGYRYAPELTVFNTELCLSSLLTVIQDLLGTPLRPRRLLLSYRSPLHGGSYAEKLGCPVEFGASCNALCLDPAILEQALPLADPVSCQHGLLQCLQQEAQLQRRPDIREQICQQLASDHGPSSSLEQVAKRLNRSPRTLRRHLQQLNSNFQQLLDEVRFDKARHLLIQTDLPIARIAEQLGYSETASFRHAFQRWSGQSPSHFRR